MALVRERILAFGPPGSGKSHQWLLLARWLKPTGAVFRIIDTDDAIARMLAEEFPDLNAENGGNVYLYPVFDWQEYVNAKNIVLKESEDNDWVVVDMADNAWKAVQGYFIQEVFKTDIADYFLKARIELAAAGDKNAKGKAARNLQPMKGWIDWPVINRIYDSFMLPLVYRNRAHLYMTAKASTISTEDDKETRNIYGPFGVRPSGQKDLAHQVHTEFLFQLGEDFGEWEFSTIKDRSRKLYDHAKLISLPKQYFMGQLGWSV